MTEKKKAIHSVFVGITDTGTYVANTTSSPYFCFEGSTHAEVLEVARQALDFYFEAPGTLQPVPVKRAEPAQLSRVYKSKKETIELSPVAA